jgi:DUF2955 family protein
MTLQTVQTLRLAFGVWTAIAVAYGVAWQLSFIAPLFTTIFLVFPVWIGWKMAAQLQIRLSYSLLLGLLISEFLLDFPIICILVYGLLFFFIYYNDTPLAPPFAAMFMTIGITIVPIMGLAGAGLPQFIAISLFVNLGLGLVFAWLFHILMPNSLATQNPQAPAARKPPPPPLLPREERIRQALTSTIVALTAIIVFFSFNLVAYAFAMIQICFMVGAPHANASAQALKDNALACCIGGVAMIVVFNLLVAVPTYLFLLALTLLCTLFFSKQMFAGTPMSKAYMSGLTTFLVLLGTSTMVDKIAAINFYLRIGQILFAGLFAIAGLLLVGYLLHPERRRLFPLLLQRSR